MLPIENDNYGVSGMAEAMKWVSVITTVVGVMIVPVLGGMWIDNLVGTKYLFVIVGAAVGGIGGICSLLNMLKVKAGAHRSR